VTLFWSLFIGLAGYAIGRITTTVRLHQEIKELGQAVWRHEQALDGKHHASRRLERSDR